MRNSFLMILGLFIIIGCIDNLQGRTTTTTQYSGEYKDCVEQKASFYSEFVSGRVLVKFKENISRDQAVELLKSYGLDVIPSNSSGKDFLWRRKSILTKTENGKELYIACKLEENDLVVLTELDSTLHTTGGNM